jgi:hypothetical protein
MGRSSGGGGRSGGGGGARATSGRSAKERYKMQQANKRWKAGVGKYMPDIYAPKNTRRGR